MSDSSSDFSAFRFIAGAGICLGVVIVLTAGLSVAGVLGDTWLDRRVVESSRQYSESNTQAFYSRLESVRKIDVQLVNTTLSPEMRSALTSQKELLESEMRREVAKIPIDSQTDAMWHYRRN